MHGDVKSKGKGSGYRPPNLGSSVHHVSIPRSVADTHNSNKIDIKNHTFIANGKNILHGSGYIAWAIGLISYIRVLRQRSYIDVAPFPTGNMECGHNPRLIP